MAMAPEEAPNSLSLPDVVKGATNGDAAAWEELVRRFGPWVLGICRRTGLQAADRADVFQEVFRAVFSGLRQVKSTDSELAFRTWLAEVVRSRVADHFRRCIREPPAQGGPRENVVQAEQEALDEPPTSGVGEQIAQLAAALSGVRAEFAESTWRAFWRTAADGISPAQVALELGMTPAAVRKAKSRVLRRLRQELRVPFPSEQESNPP
jgi:RNA polymerase sigma-70 factor (ECF subfamily)